MEYNHAKLPNEIINSYICDGGKTTTAEQIAGSVLQNQSLAKLNPKLLLEGKTPRLLDEWREAPELWDAVR